MKRLKIALMTYAADGRVAKGTALYTRSLVTQLLKNNRHDYHLVHYEPSEEGFYQMGAKEILMPRIPQLLYGTRFLRQMLFFWRYRREQFDIIHWFQPRLYPFFWFAPAKHSVVTVHGAGDITAPAHFNFSKLMFNFILRYFNNHLSALITVSHHAKQEVTTHYHASPGRIYVTYNGGGEDFSPMGRVEATRIAEKYGIDGPYLLDISRLQTHKNIPTLVEAYEHFRDTDPVHTELLVLVGVAVNGYSEPIRRIKNSRYTRDIVLLAYVPPGDLNALYSAATALVFPSLNEGFGLPVLEAMAAGTPVITSHVTALPEIAGDAALLVDPHNPHEIAAAIHRVVSDDSLARSLRERGLENAKRFSWTKTAKETESLYDLVSQH